ncbi:MAG: helix-turn-helix domain-containing protein [Gammaproteobacteria bacterium]|nr:helix-turn-helix domain-containing protein [Gammaproteobacteria bacterium]
MGVAAIVVLSTAERSDLERTVRASSTAQSLALRARMILALASGLSITETAEQLGVWRKTVSQWRRRWLTLSGSARERLSDEPRSGGPCRISAEEKCAIIALACKKPKDFGLPLSHWSASDLAREALQQNLVNSLSPRTAGRLLKRCRPQAAPPAGLADVQRGS